MPTRLVDPVEVGGMKNEKQEANKHIETYSRALLLAIILQSSHISLAIASILIMASSSSTRKDGEFAATNTVSYTNFCENSIL